MSPPLCYIGVMKTKKENFWSEYYLKTWVVGVNHYVPNLYKDSKVKVRREPDNSYDHNAVAVVNEKGERCGYLPRYDSRYFAPLLDRDEVEIELEPTGERQNERVSIILRVKLQPRGKFVYDDLKSDDIKAVYHQTMVEVWRRVDGMSDREINRFRGYFRDIVHDDAAACETQFLYRMLKGVPEQRRAAAEMMRAKEQHKRRQEEKQRLDLLRDELTAALGEIETRGIIERGRVKIVPLVCGRSDVRMTIDCDAIKSGTLIFDCAEDQHCIRAVNEGTLPVLCRAGTRINDGFQILNIKNSCIIAAGGEALLEVTTHFYFSKYNDRSSDFPEQDQSGGEAECYEFDFDKERVCLALSKCAEKFEMLDGCNGAAVFVDGMFDSLEIYSCAEMLKRAFAHERALVPENSGYMGMRQTHKVIQQMICGISPVSESSVTDGPAKKHVDLSGIGASGQALLGAKRLLYMALFREQGFRVD